MYPYHSGRLWELDGLQSGPIDHGKVDDSDWLNSARPVIQERMQKYSTGEIHFNLLAVCEDKIQKLKLELDNFATNNNDIMMRYIREKFQHLSVYFSQTKDEIKSEEEKRARFNKDNIRRRHNFLPLVVEIIKQMASEKKLVSAVDR